MLISAAIYCLAGFAHFLCICMIEFIERSFLENFTLGLISVVQTYIAWFIVS